MLKELHAQRGLQLAAGFLVGLLFGFLLQKGGVTNYDVIIGQLLFKDFTVIKVMFSAVVTGMVGIDLLKGLGLVKLQPRFGSFGSTVIGGLIFGVGFGILGYCPGTLAGAAGQGNLDVLVGGMAGLLAGTGIFAAVYPKLSTTVLNKGSFGDVTFPQLLKVNPWLVIIPLAAGIMALLFWLESLGL